MASGARSRRPPSSPEHLAAARRANAELVAGAGGYVLVERVGLEYAIILGPAGKHLWVQRKTKGPHRCAAGGAMLAAGAQVFRPIGHGSHLSTRIAADLVDRAGNGDRIGVGRRAQ